MSYTATRKRNFRLSETIRKGRKWGKYLISTCLLMAGSVHASPETAAPTVNTTVDTTVNTTVNTTVDTEQLRELLHNHVAEEIQLFAARHQWRDLKTDIDIAVPAAVNHLPACREPMVISAGDQQSQPVGNLKRQVSCNSPEQKWRLNTTVKVRIKLPVVVANSTINRDTKIAPDMLKMQTLTFQRSKDFVTQFQAVTGKRTKRRIRSGQLVSPSFLQQQWLVEKGDEVLIIANKNGMQASMKGIALENGAKNEQISVKNSSSSKVIRAFVAGQGKVKTIF